MPSAAVAVVPAAAARTAITPIARKPPAEPSTVIAGAKPATVALATEAASATDVTAAATTA
jgi:hypothetical protein